MRTDLYCGNVSVCNAFLQGIERIMLSLGDRLTVGRTTPLLSKPKPQNALQIDAHKCRVFTAICNAFRGGKTHAERTAETVKPWPIFVISLADQIQRRKHIEGQLAALGLDYTMVDAVDGRRGLPRVCELLVDRKGTVPRMRRNMSDAEYACALSHMMVYRMVIDLGLPGAIILEDDAGLEPGFRDFVTGLAYQRADIVKLDYARAAVWKWWSLKLCPDVEAYRLTRNAGLLTGYTVSRRAAARLLARGLPIRKHADWPIEIALLKSFVAFPRLVVPTDQAGSTLAPERSAIKRKMARKRSAFRRVREAVTKLVSSQLP